MDDDESVAAAGAAADLSVLDELITDVQAEAGPDSPEYYDTADAGDFGDEGDVFTADDVLRQLDTVTRLSDSDDNDGEGHDSTASADSPSSSPLREAVAEVEATVREDGTPAADQGAVHAVDEDKDVSDIQSADTAIPDLQKESPGLESAGKEELSAPEARVADDSGPEEEGSGASTEDSTLRDKPATEELAMGVDDEQVGADSVSDAVSDCVVATGTPSETAIDQVLDAEDAAAKPVLLDDVNDDGVDGGQESELPPHPVGGADEDGAVVPPPAPARAAVVMSGSMNPEVDGDSDDSDSDEEGEGVHVGGERLPASPPAPVVSASDPTDDDDELEVDPAVASTIQLISRASKKETTDKAVVRSDISGFDTKAEDASVGFGDEIRMATVVVESELDSSTTSDKAVGSFGGVDEKAVNAKQQQQAKKNDDVAFGIAYQSTKKRSSSFSPVDDADEYTLPRGPAFPDEKEFERDVQINSEGSFSARYTRCQPHSRQEDADDRADDAGDDDEFFFDGTSDAGTTAASSDVTHFSTEELEAKKTSMAARKAQEEAKLLEELKRATDDERKMIERAEAAEHQQQVGSVASTGTDTTLSFGELHSMYKRGLGDQSVHFLDETAEGHGKSGAGATSGAPGPTNEGPKAKKAANPPAERLSVMGRLLSKPHALTDVIMEAENEDEGDDQDGEFSGEEGHDHDEMSTGDAARFGVRPNQQTLLSYNDDDCDDEDDDMGGGEWKEIQLTEKATCIAANNADGSADDAVASSSSPLKPPQQQWRISYTESAGYFAEAPEFLDQRDCIVPEEFPARASCFSCLSRPRLTFPGAIDERDRVFCIAATAFYPANDVFCRMLQTIYARLVPSTSAPSLIGGHWELIGFQGSDPATDLRGVGVLALLQMLYLTENHGELARRLHSLSQHSTRHFPFACALINTTLQCLVALRSGALYPECNKHSSIVAGINMLFVALSSQLTAELAATTEDVPLVLKRVLDRGRLEPMAAINAVFDAAASTAIGSTSDANGPSNASGGTLVSHPSPVSPRARPSASTNVEFTEIALHSMADD